MDSAQYECGKVYKHNTYTSMYPQKTSQMKRERNTWAAQAAVYYATCWWDIQIILGDFNCKSGNAMVANDPYIIYIIDFGAEASEQLGIIHCAYTLIWKKKNK